MKNEINDVIELLFLMYFKNLTAEDKEKYIKEIEDNISFFNGDKQKFLLFLKDMV